MYFKDKKFDLTHRSVFMRPLHLLINILNLFKFCLSSFKSISCERIMINLCFLLCCVTLIALYYTSIGAFVHTVYHWCFPGGVSQRFLFLSLFSLLLQHLPASQLSDSSAPCFSAFWLTCSSLLPSTVSFKPRGSLHSLCFSCFHF